MFSTRKAFTFFLLSVFLFSFLFTFSPAQGRGQTTGSPVAGLAMGIHQTGVQRSISFSHLSGVKPILTVSDVSWSQYLAQGDGDDVVEPGETWEIQVTLSNNSSADAKLINTTLTLVSGDAIVVVGASTYPNIPVGATQINTTLFRVKVKNTQVCDQNLSFDFYANYKRGNNKLNYTITKAVGGGVGVPCDIFNTAPTAVDDYYATTFGTPLNILARDGVLVNDIDAEFDPLMAHLDQGTIYGTVSLNQDGSFTYTPNPDAVGPDFFSYYVSDGQEDSQVATVWITLTANHFPVLSSIGSKTVNELTQLTFTAHATDLDSGDTLTYSLDAGAPSGASIDPVTGVFTWTPTEAQGPGIYDVIVRVTDNGTPPLSDYEIVRVTVNEVNTDPSLSIPEQTVDELTELAFTIVASDSDIPANVFDYTIVVSDTVGASVTIDGDFTWTPSEADGPGDYSVTVRVTDDDTPSSTATGTFSIHVNEVNQAPVLAAIGNKSVNEQADLTFTASATDSDLPAQTVTYHLADGSSGQVPTGAVMNSFTGAFSWTPTEAQGPGDYTFDVCASDGIVNSCETIKVTVNKVNDPPVALNDSYSTSRDQVLIVDQVHGVLANDTDADGDSLTATVDALPTHGSLNLNSNGSFTYTPEQDFSGSDGFTYNVSDGDGGSAKASVSITVNAVNHPPVAQDQDVTTDEDTAIDITLVATDFENSQLTYEVVTQPSHGTLTGTAPDLTYTPDPDFNGDDSFTFSANDSFVDSNPATVSITVTSVNDAPVVVAGTDQTVDEGQEVTFDGSYTDDDPVTTGFQLEWDFGDGATATGTLTPTHTYADDGDYTVTLKVTDSYGLSKQNTLQVKVNNVAPLLDSIADQKVKTNQLVNLNATFTDPGTLDTFNVSIEWEPGVTQHLTSLVPQTQDISSSHTYTKKGLYTVTVTVTDKDSGQSTQTFQVQVDPYTLYLPAITNH